MTALRRFTFTLRLARARLARRTGRLVLVALGLAAAAATLAAVLAGSLVAQDRSIAREVEGLPEPTRAVRAVWFGVPPAEGPGLDELAVAARAALREVVPAKPEEVVLFRRTNVGGALVDLGAVEGLGRWVDLRSGRLPRTCRPERCEVLQLAGNGPTPRLGDLRFAIVGRAVLRSDALFGEFLPPGVYHQPATPPLLLAEGLDVLAAAPELASRYRSYAWVVPLDDVAVRPWETDALGDRVARARSSLRSRDSSFDVAAPVAEISRAGEDATAAGRRLLLVGGQAAALLLAFAVLAAATLRRDVAAARRRLTWFGARRAQLETLTLAEVAAVGLVGTLAGWTVGVGIAALVAERTGAPVAGVLLNSVLSTGGLVVALALVVVTTLVVFLAVRAQPLRVGGLALAPVDVAALGALAVVATILLRGDADADALAREGGTGTVLLLLPGLVSFVAAVACARALGPALRGLERLTRRRGVPLRLASLSLARSAGHATVAIAFLTVSLGLALFAEAYRSTLARGQEDQAAYAAPVEAIAREDLRELVRPLDAASPEEYAEIAGGGRASAVLRRAGNVARLEGSRAVTLLALPEAALRELDGWRGDFASRSPDELARLVASEGESALRGIPLPDDVRELQLPTDLRGTPIRVTATLATREGRFVPADFGLADRGPGELRVPVPREARGGLLVGLTFRPPRRIEEPGASAGRPALGVLTVGQLELVGARTTRSGFEGWIPPDPSIAAVVAGRRTQFHFALTNLIHARFRPRQPTDGDPVPVLATPRVAAAAGARRVLPVELGGQTLLGQVVGVVRRFPTVEGEAVVADAELVQTALNANQPGSALPNEVWLDVPPELEAVLTARLASPPFDRLELTVRSEVERGLRADPLARAALLTLATAALVGLGLALVGLLLGALSELRDERGELFDLEAQGATPADLRRQVRLRAAMVALTGLLGGLLTGLALSALVVDLVRLTANAAAAEPPLRLSLSWPVALAALALYGLAATVLVGIVTRRAFRTSVPAARASELAA